MTNEVRITSPTGGQKGQKEARFGGADPLAMIELAKVYGMGEEKYARYNYLKGYKWSLSVDALFRHLFAFLSGEDRDPESGLLHTAHVAWHANTLTSFQMRRIGEDDRAPVEGGAVNREDYPLWHPKNPYYESNKSLSQFLAQMGYTMPPVENYPDHADMSVDERRYPGPYCDHGLSLYEECDKCPEEGRQLP